VKPSTRTMHQHAVLNALVFVQDHLDEHLDLEQLARVAAMAPFHFHRVFRALVGETPIDHVRRLRLERAARGLKMTSTGVGELARLAGYESHEAFTRAFRGHFGVTPSQFRDARAQQGLVAEPAPGAPTLPQHDPRSQARLEQLPPLRVAFVRHVGPYEAVAGVFERLTAWCRDAGIEPAPLIGVAHDDPDVSANHVRFDACVPVGPEVTGAGDVGIQSLPGGEHASVTHHGPFDQLAHTYRWLCTSFMPTVGRVPRKAPCLELYLTDVLAEPADPLVEVLIPTEPPRA
jgi:AraC family transcriptional regulator